MANELAGQVAIVTGAGRGFGRAIATGFAEAGAAVTVTARTKAEIDETAAIIEQSGGRALSIAGDVTNRQDVERVTRETLDRFGGVNILVHNAGVPSPFGPIGHVDPDEWWDAQAVHVRGAFLYLSAVVPMMIERGGGRVIVVSSNAGTRARPNLSAYGVAKATQIRLVETLAEEGREHGIFAWSCQPGSVFTGISEITIASPDAQRYLPDFVERLHRQRAEEDPNIGLRRCAEMCLELVSGRCDVLSGRFVRPEDDLAALVREAQAGAQAR
jgi:NAD(P)-dependent dehydrogenase (short-subunit alcohol dehydrogenase family)